MSNSSTELNFMLVGVAWNILWMSEMYCVPMHEISSMYGSMSRGWRGPFRTMFCLAWYLTLSSSSSVTGILDSANRSPKGLLFGISVFSVIVVEASIRFMRLSSNSLSVSCGFSRRALLYTCWTMWL